MARTPKPWFRKGRGWFVTIDGKQHNLGREKKCAYQEYHRLMQQPAERRKVSGQSLAAIIDDFLEYLAKNKAPDTYRWYRDLLQKFIVLHPNLSVDDIRPYHVQRWVDGYEHLSKSSRTNHLRAVKRCVKWAVTQGYLDRNPLQYLSVPAYERREVVISEEEFAEVLAYTKPDSLRDLFIVTWETGCRPQESLRVEARHVDVKHHRWVIPPSEAKGERITRSVYLTDKALEITQRLMREFPEGNLFRNTNGDAWNADSVNCAVDRIRIRMGKQAMKELGRDVTVEEVAELVSSLKPTCRCRGIERRKTEAELRYEAKVKLTNKLAASLAPRYSLYAFRHSFATHALERGVDSVTLRRAVGSIKHAEQKQQMLAQKADALNAELQILHVAAATDGFSLKRPNLASVQELAAEVEKRIRTLEKLSDQHLAEQPVPVNLDRRTVAEQYDARFANTQR